VAATTWAGRNPTAVDPLLGRAAARAARSDWVGVREDARAALALHPLHPWARLYLAAAKHRLGDTAGGRADADAALGLISPDLPPGRTPDSPRVVPADGALTPGRPSAGVASTGGGGGPPRRGKFWLPDAVGHIG
jgi:hypothetical protein